VLLPVGLVLQSSIATDRESIDILSSVHLALISQLLFGCFVCSHASRCSVVVDYTETELKYTVEFE
jgi:hypothetical protein